MTQEELVKIANELALRHWGVPFDGEIVLVNRDWKRYNAYFKFNRKTGLKQIRMSKKVNARRTRDEVIGSLLHELVHWRLWSLGLNAHDTSDEFISECLRVGAPLSGARNAQEAYKRYIQKNGVDANGPR